MNDEIKNKIEKQKKKIIESIEKANKDANKKKMAEIKGEDIDKYAITKFEDKDISRYAVTPEIERNIFPYYVAGSSLVSIWRKFGKELSFSIDALQNAVKVYKWDDRIKDIRNLMVKSSTEGFVDKQKQMNAFLESLIEQAMMDNLDGKMKINSMRDFKEIISVWIQLNQGNMIKKVEISGTIEHNHKNIADSKAAKILEILANDDVVDAEIKEVEKEKNNVDFIEKTHEYSYTSNENSGDNN